MGRPLTGEMHRAAGYGRRTSGADLGRKSDDSDGQLWSYAYTPGGAVMSPVITTTHTQPKPRAYAIPVVRPVPPRPAATGTAGTW